MLEQHRKDDMTRLAMECISLGGRPRPELRWLNRRYDRVKKRCGLRSKTETDKLLYYVWKSAKEGFRSPETQVLADREVYARQQGALSVVRQSVGVV